MSSNDMLFYILMTCITIFAICVVYATYVVMIVTPRVDRLNNTIPYWTFMLSARHAALYLWSFHPNPLPKSWAFYQKHVGKYKATPTDILHFKIYKYVAFLFPCLLSFIFLLARHLSEGL